ncbi:MAG: tRNA pseudouridine(55) synthase TruB [Candidatus Marinimicrobia bacterium]|nr:tRNA pseudouridine(55) synthase TruB [Candidatus Neomarinimicrobiota bacterium]MBL7010105.1 tRNA pseudouridine(55) synthase TruB [Candidatus Neomarinimicrobiota bacterium]MBL7029984.1 tRNA pseudouridine(55) synthase TruB [Candidatus Neomarinimicrobiota bacterium]
MIYNIYKPVGWTSFDVVKKLRGITKDKKVGHGGTLDPFAEGVLIIGTHSDTKRLTDISGSIKSYRTILSLGEETDTLDIDGKVIHTCPVPVLNEAKIKIILNEFLGESAQIPPMYSAKKVNGVRLYKLARKNQTVERKPTPIKIYNIKLNQIEGNQVDFSVTCSKGTYIRVLGMDIAKRLGTVGYLTKLTRTAVGSYKVHNSVGLKEFEKQWMSIAH